MIVGVNGRGFSDWRVRALSAPQVQYKPTTRFLLIGMCAPSWLSIVSLVMETTQRSVKPRFGLTFPSRYSMRREMTDLLSYLAIPIGAN